MKTLINRIAGQKKTILCVVGTGMALGNVGVASAADTSAPAVGWKKPVNGAWLAGVIKGHGCQAGARDNVRVRRVKFFVDGKLVRTETRRPYNCRIDTTQLKNGLHSLKVMAVDRAGNTRSRTIAVTVANGTSSTTPVVTPPAAPTPVQAPTAPVPPSPAPTPAPLPVGAPSPFAPPPIWSGNFDTADFSQWSIKWPNNPTDSRLANSSDARYSLVSSPVRDGNKAVKLTVYNTDVAPITPTNNPRAQIEDKSVALTEGSEYYYSFSVYFPASFPKMATKNPDGSYPYFGIASAWGKPFNGSGLLTFGVHADYPGGENRIDWRRGQQYGSDVAWSTPLVRDQWNDFVVHAKFSKNTSVGFAELWFNGVKQTLKGGVTRLQMATMAPDASGPYYFHVNSYRRANMWQGAVTTYADAIKIGKSYESVAQPGR